MKDWKIRLLIVLTAGALYLPFLGNVNLFDWDEINFAESAREMIITGDYLTVRIDYQPFWEKPPVFSWMQVAGMTLFGIGEYGARVPNAICGIITLLLLFEFGKRLRNKEFGLIWAMVYGLSVLPFMYFKTGIIDPWFNLFIFLSAWFLYRWTTGKSQGLWKSLLAGVFIGLAVLTKGPAAYALLALAGIFYLIFARKEIRLRPAGLILFIITAVGIGSVYHILQYISGNKELVTQFLDYQLRLLQTEDAGHGGSFLYHPMVLFFGVFPASLFAIPSLFKRDPQEEKSFRHLAVGLFWVVLIIFSLVQTKIMHYSSLTYFSFTYFAAVTLVRWNENGRKWPVWLKIILITIATVYSAAPGLLQWAGNNAGTIIETGWIKDPFAEYSLQSPVIWQGWEFATGLIFITAVIWAILTKGNRKRMILLFTGTGLFLFVTSLVVIPRVEGYSQRPAIEMARWVQSHGGTIYPIGYKSFAHLFYSNKNEPTDLPAGDMNALINTSEGKNLYLVGKRNKKDETLKYFPVLEVVKEEGGFVLYRRP